MMMLRDRKVNRKGRSSGRPLPQIRKFLSPPQGESWTFLPKQLLESHAWRAMSPNTSKLIFCLMIDHCSHAGRGNGHLIATYDQLEEYGLTRGKIREAIEEAEYLGLVKRSGMPQVREVNRFRLTFYASFDDETGEGAFATNGWKSITQEKITAIRAEQKARRAGKREAKRIKKELAGT